MKISKAGIELIKSLEGYRADAYRCSAGVWTIGYGHTKGVKPGQVITKEQGEIFLREDLKTFEEAVNKLVKVEIPQSVYDAMVSFTFNVGIGNLTKSTLLKLVKLGKLKEAADELAKWVFVTPTPGESYRLNGLIKRREVEKKLWLSGVK